MRAWTVAALLALTPLTVAQAGPAEKAAKALFEGKADAGAVAKLWRKKRLKPAKAAALVRGFLPFERGPKRDHTITLA
jgi:hypothetical protein